jgi:hypothetical protein
MFGLAAEMNLRGLKLDLGFLNRKMEIGKPISGLF